MGDVTILDGPMGTELVRLGVPTPAPMWSAWAIEHAPDAVLDIHRANVQAGAHVITANTFRTTSRVYTDEWRELSERAVGLAHEAIGHARVRVAGSMAPREDCYRPDLAPRTAEREHAEQAVMLADTGIDLLLCETFANVAEALLAVRAGVATGLETWVAFTGGPHADLLSPDEVGRGAGEAARLGAAAVLLNCTPASRTLGYVRALGGAGVPFGAYANAGLREEGLGWSDDDDAPARYADLAATWIDAGATIVGGCCGTGAGHIAELTRRFAC